MNGNKKTVPKVLGTACNKNKKSYIMMSRSRFSSCGFAPRSCNVAQSLSNVIRNFSSLPHSSLALPYNSEARLLLPAIHST